MIIRANLHTHSCLSPCALREMTPRALARQAHRAGLDALALTDHNAADNTPAFVEACRAEGLYPFPGLEITTAEGAHVLALFDDADAARAAGAWIFDHLPDDELWPERLMDQLAVAGDELSPADTKFFGNPTDLPLSVLCAEIPRWGGLCIPSHVDRRSYSLWSVLGHVPDLPCHAVEVTPYYALAADPLNLLDRYALITSADAHALDDIGRVWIEFEAERPSLASLERALIERRITMKTGRT